MGKDNKISRKEFLRLGGSVIAGGVIAGTAGSLRWKMARKPDELFVDSDAEGYAISDGDSSVSPYRRISALSTPGDIEAFEMSGERMIVAVGGKLLLFGPDGASAGSFPVGEDVRDLAVDGERIYVLFPTRIAVYDLDGTPAGGWNACSDDADYCSLTVTPDGVFVTDAGSKLICKYRKDGSLDRFIRSPHGFVVPSYTFGITHHDGIVYCSNPGRHLVESYTGDGAFISAFGTAGTAPGHFSGCCNPVFLTVSPNGEILASEKGIPRVSCYGTDGSFRSILLNKKALGGGSAAYEVRISRDGRIFAAGRNSLSVYLYDERLARAAAGESVSYACSLCERNCPLRRGTKI